MKKILAVLLATLLVAALASCGVKTTTTDQTTTPGGSGEATEPAETSEVAEPVTDESITASEATGEFSITTEDGTIEVSDNIYKISSAGTYVLSGLLEGQILVEAGEEDEVVLELTGATLKNGSDSPIKILSADSVEISAKKGTENIISDTRSAKTTDDENQGKGAIYAKCDLKLKGAGTLVVSAGYNNGIHTTKDLKIQKLSLKVTAPNNALKGNDSITITSGTVVAISTGGDGIKTENTDADKKGNTRGNITISGGSVAVYAAGDGIQAAHNFELSCADEVAPNVLIYTGSYSGYTAASASTTSYKGVKVENELNILDGSITIHSYDDGLHANYGTVFEDGTTGQGKIGISGGTVEIAVYSPTVSKTPGGRPGAGGPGGWGGQQTVSGADGIHADNTLAISGGTVLIDSSYEGLEATHIVVTGGKTIVAGNDDGMNAAKKINETPSIEVSGGYLDVTVSPNGDTDGIDSNGTYLQTGGVVITRGPNNQNMSAIDADGSVTISGGTLIVLGYGNIKTSGSVKSYSLSLHSAGSHTVTVGGVSYAFTNAYAYGRTICYSDVEISA